MLNNFEFIGNVASDPEMRYTPSGVPVCSFTVAVNKRKRNQSGEYEDQTTWVRATVWRNSAEYAASSIQKGDIVYAAGPLEIRDYVDREGNKRFSIDVNAEKLTRVYSRALAEQRRAQKEAAANGEYVNGGDVVGGYVGPTEADLEEIPF